MLRNDLERKIVRLAIPALGTLAVEPVYVLVDTAIVGRLGTPQLAGVAIASVVLLNVIGILAFLEYITPDIAFAVGAARGEEARRIAAYGGWLSVMLGVPMAVLLALVARPLCWLIGGRGEVLDHATTYLSISALGVPFVLLAFLGHGVLRGYNDMRTPLKIVVVANIANLVLEIVAVYGLHMGVAGSAATTVLVQMGAALWFMWAIRRHLAPVRPSWTHSRPLLVMGAHVAVRSIAMNTVWNVSTVIAAHLDAATLAANQVVTQLFMFLALMLDALAVPLHSLVAGELGAGNPREADRIGHISVRLSLWAAARTGHDAGRPHAGPAVRLHHRPGGEDTDRRRIARAGTDAVPRGRRVRPRRCAHRCPRHGVAGPPGHPQHRSVPAVGHRHGHLATARAGRPLGRTDVLDGDAGLGQQTTLAAAGGSRLRHRAGRGTGDGVTSSCATDQARQII